MDLSLSAPRGSDGSRPTGKNTNLQVFVLSFMPSGVSWRLWGTRSSRTGWKPRKYFKSLGTGKRFQNKHTAGLRNPGFGVRQMGSNPSPATSEPQAPVRRGPPRKALQPTEPLLPKPQTVPIPKDSGRFSGRPPLGEPGLLPSSKASEMFMGRQRPGGADGLQAL